MAEDRRNHGPCDPREDLERITRSLRLRLEGEARAGLAAVRRARGIPAQATPAAASAAGAAAAGETEAGAAVTDAQAAGTPDDAAPEPECEAEIRAAEAARRELAERAAQAKAAGRPGAAPVVHVKGPQLFDLNAADAGPGVSPEEALQRVAEEVAACPRCPELVASRTKTVPGQGSPYAKLMFIGEGPGQDEDLQGLAFVGRAGQLLSKMIESIGMTRDEVFIANIVKCRPPANRQPSPEEAANCRPFLMRQLSAIRPRIIVALGGVAAQNLLETHDGITRLRGRFYPFMGAKLMPTFHPAYLLRNYTPDVRKKVYDDLLKVKAELQA